VVVCRLRLGAQDGEGHGLDQHPHPTDPHGGVRDAAVAVEAVVDDPTVVDLGPGTEPVGEARTVGCTTVSRSEMVSGGGPS
jgi:hypothetical protein